MTSEKHCRPGYRDPANLYLSDAILWRPEAPTFTENAKHLEADTLDFGRGTASLACRGQEGRCANRAWSS